MNRSLQRTALAAVGMLAAVSMAWAAPQSQPDEARYKVYLPEIFNGAPVPPPAPSVAVSLSAEPYQVDEGSDPWFDVIVTARNTGQVDAGNIAVTVSYDPSQSALVYWPSNVTAIDNDSVTMVFDGPIAPGASATGTLVFEASSADSNGEIVQFEGSYSIGGTNASTTNTASVQVLGELPTPPGAFSCNVTPPNPPLGVQPATGRGVVGTQFLFAAFDSICGYNFSPGETVSFWVNQPDGSILPLASAIADADGDVERYLNTFGDASGCYSTVASNQSQNNVLVGAFILDPESGQAQCGGQSQAARPAAAHKPRLSAPAQPAQTGRGGVRGRVTGVGGAPLAGVLAVVRDGATGAFLASALTDAGGAYAVPSTLASGEYQVTFFASRSRNGASAAYADRSLPVRVSEPGVAVLDAALAPGGAINGRVTTEESTVSLRDVAVQLYDATGTNLLAVTSTDSSGRYTTPALPDGSYRLRFVPERSLSAATRAYVAEFYNDQPNGAAASLVTISGATEVSGVDAALRRCADCGEIVGQVRAQDTRAGLEGLEVAVQDAATGRLVALARTDATGAYHAIVPSGMYRVAFLADNAAAPATRAYLEAAALDPTNVSAPRITAGVDATFARGAQIGGRVRAAENGAPLKNITVEVLNASGTLLATTTTAADGRYTTPGLASGSYRLVFRPADGAANLPYAQAEREVAVTAPAAVNGIDVALARLQIAYVEIVTLWWYNPSHTRMKHHRDL